MTLEIIDITKRFGLFTLGPLSLSIDKDVMVILGPTGSGKTTLINLVAGIIRADKGRIILDGVDITNKETESRRIGYVFQDPTLFPHLDVYENILFGIKRKERENRETMILVRKIIDDLGIANLLKRSIDGLSGGEMQKISLARMLVISPKIILLDEPLSHLDTSTQDRLRIELRSILRKQRLPTIYVTHFEEDIYALSDSIAILKNGKIEETGNLEQILNSYNKPLSPSHSFLYTVTGGGNYISGKVINSKNDLTAFKVGSNILFTVGIISSQSKIGVMVKREDIILSKEKIRTSARNMVYCEVVDIMQRSNVVDVYLKSDELKVVSRITKTAAEELGITVGEHVYAIFKASAPHIIREDADIK
jgi:molybdate/tungstate transport system ATP-binding protein